MSDPDLERFWHRLGHPATACSQCKAEKNPDDSPITWRCEVCGRLVCRDCTLTLPRLVRKTSDGSYQDWGLFVQGRLRPPAVVNEEAMALVADEEFGESVAALRGGGEYLTRTLCSRDCWETAGRPDE